MVWAKIDDDILDNEKILNVGALGFALHVAAITWCCRNLTDGFIPRVRVGSLLNFEGLHEITSEGAFCANERAVDALDIADVLVANGLWREDDERRGYWLNDFLEYNPSREEVEATREARSASGKKGAASRWGKKGTQASATAPAMTDDSTGAIEDKTDRQTDSKRHSKQMAPAMANPCESHGKPMANLCPDPDPDPDPNIHLARAREAHTQEPEPTRFRLGFPDPSEPAPEWWPSALGTISVATAVDLPPSESWLRYAGHRNNKRLPATQPDAIQWLTNVMVREARDQREKARAAADRESKWERARAGPRMAPDALPPPTEAEAKANAEKLARRIAERKARESKGAA